MKYAHLSREHKLESALIMDKMPGVIVRKSEETSGEKIAQELSSHLLHSETKKELVTID
jgi:hypothetical protein